MPRRALNYGQRDEPLRPRVQAGDEIAQILIEQHRIDGHIHERVHPGNPSILKSPEAAEYAIDPAIIATFFRHHAGELADDERFGQGPNQRNQQ